MIRSEDLSALKAWFDAFAEDMIRQCDAPNGALHIKQVHTKKVCEEAVSLAHALGMSPEKILLAEAIALMHDVGRFEQFSQYRTFSDIASRDHGELGVQVILEHRLLGQIDLATRKIILQAIVNHSKRIIDPNLKGPSLLFTKLIRDADKLDLWRVMSASYAEPCAHTHATLVHGYPDRPEISPEVSAPLLAGCIADIRDVKTVNDLKLLHMGLVYDIHFPATFERIHERGYLPAIQRTLPESELVEALSRGMQEHVDRRRGR